MSDPNKHNPFASSADPESQQPAGFPVSTQGSNGMFGAIPAVCILQISIGALEMLYGLFMGGFMGLATTFESPGGIGNDWMFQIGFLVFAGLIGTCGFLRVVSGVLGLQYKAWWLMLVSLCIGFFTLFTCYCAPFSIVTGVFGIIVLADSRVRIAFQLRSEGHSVAAVRQAITGR